MAFPVFKVSHKKLNNPLNTNKLIFLANLLNEVSNILANSAFLGKLDYPFFNLLYGLSPSYKLPDDSEQLEQLLLLILYLRLTGGLDIFVRNYQDGIYLINFAYIEENFAGEIDYRKRDQYISDILKKETIEYSSALKEILLKPESLTPSPDNNLNTLVILTHNRPEQFKICLEQYINNLKKFKHNSVKIIVSDDSEPAYSSHYQEIIKEAQQTYPKIEYLNNQAKEQIIAPLIEQAIKKYPQTDSNFFRYYIPYIFSINSLTSSVGSNRNFISYYLKGKAFVCVDDDSRPQVLTYTTAVFKSAVKQMVTEKNFDLRKINNYISATAEQQLINVDFWSYYQHYNYGKVQYVRYSGHRDINSYFHFIKEFGFDLEAIGVYDLFSGNQPDKLAEFKRNFPYITYTYQEKENHKLRMHGLCCYYPPNFFKMRVTLPEKLRIEDLLLGAGFFLETGIHPVENGFALYHDRPSAETSLSAADIHHEIISIILYDIYLQLLGRLSGNTREKIFSLYHALQAQQVDIPESSFQYIEHHKKLLVKIFSNALKQAEKVNDEQKITKIKKITVELEVEFFSGSYEENKQRVKLFINNVIKKYINSVVTWLMLNDMAN